MVGTIWAPLRTGYYRPLWLAVLASQVGTWMQTVGAQWQLVHVPHAATLVSLVQTASALPVLLLALPAGVLADSLDRRRLLIAVQCYQFAVGVLLTVLTVAGQMTPALLLTLTFGLGCGAAMTVPTYQSIVPELVPREQLPSASALAAVSVNIARAIGPALAGMVVGRLGIAPVFAVNALTFAAFAGVLVAWRRPSTEDSGGAERFVAALRAGGRYVRHSPVMRRFLFRVALFILPAVALWALLPLVASQRLGMGAGGYGVLLAALGAGAIAGAFVLPRLRGRLSDNGLLVVASVAYTAVLVVLALVRNRVVVTVALVPAGTAWMLALSNVNAAVQLFLPGWVRARGLAAYQVVFFGGQALGAPAWGLVAQHVGLVESFLAAAACTAAGVATVRFWPLHDTRDMNREPAAYWAPPRLAVEPDPDAGPVVVTLAYTVAPEDEDEFRAAMLPVRRSRLRSGAVQWGLFRDGEVPDRLVEAYVVPTWQEHMYQHDHRLTGTDQEIELRARALSRTDPEVAHLLPIDGTDPRGLGSGRGTGGGAGDTTTGRPRAG